MMIIMTRDLKELPPSQLLYPLFYWIKGTLLRAFV